MKQLMHMISALAVLLIIKVFTLGTIAFAQQTIIYYPFNESFTEQISLQVANNSKHLSEQQFSPNQLGWVQVTNSDFSEEGPWSTAILIQHTDATTLQLDLLNHANVQPTATWINDERLHINIWWGRLLGSDLIFDLSKSEFIYRKMFTYSLYQENQVNVQPASSSQDIFLKLEYVQGADLLDYRSFELISLETEFDTIRQFTVGTVPPTASYCYLEASLSDIQTFETFIQSFIAEQMEKASPQPTEMACRNCTLYEMTWEYQNRKGRFIFSDQNPFRYSALENLFPLIETVLKRLPSEAECDA